MGFKMAPSCVFQFKGKSRLSRFPQKKFYNIDRPLDANFTEFMITYNCFLKYGPNAAS